MVQKSNNQIRERYFNCEVDSLKKEQLIFTQVSTDGRVEVERTNSLVTCQFGNDASVIV